MATGGKTDVARAIATISRAAGSKSNWRDVAKVVAFIRDEDLWRGFYPSAGEWLEAAAATYGVSLNTLRRLIAAHEFLEAKLAKRHREGQSIDFFAGSGTFAMSTVEQIMRMHDVSPPHADKALDEHAAGRLSYRDAKAQYDALSTAAEFGRVNVIVGDPPYTNASIDAAKVSSRRAHKQRSILKALIESHLEALSGLNAESATISKKRFEYVSPDAIVIGNADKKAAFVDGYAFKRLPLRSTGAAVAGLLSEAAFSASFFRRYWLILDANEIDAKRVTDSVTDLELRNVGVARYKPEGQDNLDLLRAPTGDPVPNRHDRSVKQALG